MLARDPLATPALSTLEVQELVRKLQAYEIELETRNDALRAAEQALAASRDRFAELYDLAPVGYLTLDAEDRILEANQTAETLLGAGLRQAAPPARMNEFVAGTDRDVWDYFRNSVYAGRGVRRCEIALTRRDGPVWIAHVEGTVSRKASGGELRCMIQLLDITEAKQMQEQLRQVQKLESVGRLAGGVAHDFNNQLMSIMGYADLCREELPEDHIVRKWLHEIKDAAQHSAALVRQLLAFARKQPGAPRVLDPNTVVADLLQLLRSLIGDGIELVWRPGEQIWPVKADASQIARLLADLCANARDAIAGPGRICIETANVELDEAYCARHAPAVAGPYVRLSITDDGCGMDQKTLEHVFEPFFTTKGVGPSTGMGLPSVHGIVKQSGGHIDISSEPGKGTSFKIYVPRCKDEPSAAREVEPPFSPPDSRAEPRPAGA